MITASSTRLLSSLNKPNIGTKELWKGINQIINKPQPAHSSPHSFKASTFNDFYSSISQDPNYTEPLLKSTCAPPADWPGEYTVFLALDSLKPTSPGPDAIPHWFYKLGAPYLAAPLAALYRLSLSDFTVPSQWKTALIYPTPKISNPLQLSDYRPISHTCLASRILERLIVRHYFYPLITDPSQPIHLALSDQHAFRPTGSTTTAISSLLHQATEYLTNEPYVRLIAVDFSKAFDTISLNSFFSQLSLLPLPDHLHNWLILFFSHRSHSTFFAGVISSSLNINCSLVQGSVFAPVSYAISTSKLKPKNDSNSMVKYADDAYLLIPASSDATANDEVTHIVLWASQNNMKVNTAKCKEIILHAKGAPPLISPPPLTSVTRSHQSLYALRVIKAHGLQGARLHNVTRALLQSRLSYAISAWVGFANRENMIKLQKVIEKADRWGLGGGSMLPSIDEITAQSDKALFSRVLHNPAHLLHSMLPPEKPLAARLRKRPHNYQLTLSNTMAKKNFITRMLFKHSY